MPIKQKTDEQFDCYRSEMSIKSIGKRFWGWLSKIFKDRNCSFLDFKMLIIEIDVDYLIQKQKGCREEFEQLRLLIDIKTEYKIRKKYRN